MIVDDGQVVCYKAEKLTVCTSENNYLHNNAERSGLRLNFEKEAAIPR